MRPVSRWTLGLTIGALWSGASLVLAWECSAAPGAAGAGVPFVETTRQLDGLPGIAAVRLRSRFRPRRGHRASAD